MTTLPTLIGASTHKVFRRALIRRRLASTGLYETTWRDITSYVKSWGQFSTNIDSIRKNAFTHSPLTLVVRNDDGSFNPETNQTSLWSGFLTRYRTQVKIEAGYYDSTGAELPAQTAQGVYLMDGEVEISGDDNQVVLNCKSLVSVFDEVRAVEVGGLGVTQTASQILAKIRDHTDGSGLAIFQTFISSGAWFIQSTTNNYNLATTTSIGEMSVWGMMSKIAEAEDFVLAITRAGGIDFRDRNPRTTTVAIDLFGQGFVNPNVIKLDNFKQALDKYYNFFRLKFRPEDTSTSYVFAGSVTTIDPSSTAWKYGTRKYEFENDFFVDTATAQTVVNNLYNENRTLRDEVNIVAKFLPDVDVGDRVTFSYRSYNVGDVPLWGTAIWDVSLWANEEGENFDWYQVPFIVLSKVTNLEKFTTALRLRAL